MAEGPTLYAPITAPGRAAVAALRLSGPEAFTAAEALAGTLPPARRAGRRRLRAPATGEVIDDALVLAFPAPASPTGEDVVELHLHGGTLPMRRVLAALADMAGLAPAGPGDFSRRAFLNGRLDLARAEAVADLVDAETEAQARQALRQLDGALGRRVADWQHRLTAARARLEAGLDFADEGDVAGGAAGGGPDLAALAAELRDSAADDRGERLREGLVVALVGAPNAGKSSLLNALAERDVAIVSEVAGTTRDVLEVPMELGGRPVTLIDTAGIRESDDLIEQEGVRRARAAAERADLRLVLIDGARWPAPAAAGAVTPAASDLVVLAKADLEPDGPRHWAGHAVVEASVLRPGGLEAV
ncbi:MAG: tRNA uridine-5-carboxymethylaminomethyl(34) synthesis GTPase MnmE, partial [Alphaproteobacteria bacterium]|nr:tRNA uridine-5-carboxymethylaminomethyl(34) synthesis GTPase MnmE [Alphaproteobacteria bacterium]